ncbi:hypothetical protein HK100_004078, partial [Physocladia obscura]
MGNQTTLYMLLDLPRLTTVLMECPFKLQIKFAQLVSLSAKIFNAVTGLDVPEHQQLMLHRMLRLQLHQLFRIRRHAL